MMNWKICVAAALCTGVLVSSASAATITNKETSPQTIRIISGDAEKSFTLAPSDKVSVDAMCPETCVIALQDGSEFEFGSSEDLSLEDGGVYLLPPVGDTPDNGKIQQN